MRKYIRRFLGIEGLESLIVMRTPPSTLEDKFQKLRDEVQVTLLAIGRIIAKTEPGFSESEFDPDRRVASDKLAKDVITRLFAENSARHHSVGD